MDFKQGSPRFPFGNLMIYHNRKPGFQLTPYVTAVNTDKSINQPAGMFDITLAYSPDSIIDYNLPGREDVSQTIEDFLDTVETFDYVEIEMQSEPSGPVHWMRGFIDNITISESAGSGNSFSRSVTISGRDYGGLLQDWGVHFFQAGGRFAFNKGGGINANAIWEALFNRNFYDIFGARKGQPDTRDPKHKDKKFKTDMPGLFNSKDSPVTAKDLVYLIVNMGINEGQIQQVKTWCPAIRTLLIDVNSLPLYFGVNPSNTFFTNFDSSMDDLVRYMQCPPWGEMFIRDDEHGPRFVFRLAPFLREDGTFAWDKPGAYFHDINFADLSRSHIKSAAITKSTQKIFTSFMTIPGDDAQDMDRSTMMSQTEADKGRVNPYNFADADQKSIHGPEQKMIAQKYGLKQLVGRATWLMGNPNKSFFVNTAPEGKGKGTGTYTLAATLNKWLVDSMGYAWKTYEGTITCRGVFNIRIGDYIYYKRRTDKTGLYFYVTGVSVDWSEDTAFTTTFNVERGQLNNKVVNHVRHVPFDQPESRIRTKKESPASRAAGQAAASVAATTPLPGSSTVGLAPVVPPIPPKPHTRSLREIDVDPSYSPLVSPTQKTIT